MADDGCAINMEHCTIKFIRNNKYKSRDYSRKLLWAVIPFAWEWVANAAWMLWEALSSPQ